jgi:hypothetical protein
METTQGSHQNVSGDDNQSASRALRRVFEFSTIVATTAGVFGVTIELLHIVEPGIPPAPLWAKVLFLVIGGVVGSGLGYFSVQPRNRRGA